MVYTIVIAPRAKKQICGLPQHIQNRVAAILEDVLARDPFKGKQLRGDLKGFFAYRVGDYRIIYDLARGKLIVMVVSVMHRREVYRRL